MTSAPEVIPQRFEENVPLDRLVPHPMNANESDVGLLCQLIDANGFAGAVMAQESSGILIDGEHRVEAARSRGMTTVPVIWVDCDDDTRDRLLAEWNESTRRGRNDEGRLVALLTGLAQTPRGLEGTAFDGDDLDSLIASLGRDEPAGGGGPEPPVPEPPAIPVTQPGDTWLLGPHRIVCGDCRDFGTVEKLLAGERVNVAFTSPPYASQRAYDESSGFRPIPPGEYVDWFEDVQSSVRAVLAEDGSWFVNIKEHCDDGQRHLYVKDLTITHVRRWGWRFVDEFAWTRNGVPGTWPNRFKNGWEPVFHFSVEGAIKFRPQAVGHESDDVFHEAGRVSDTNRTGNVGWSGSDVTPEHGIALPSNVVHLPVNPASMQGAEHSAAFPVALPQWFIRAYSDPGDSVFDPFMGSGSTLIAADQENRVAYGCEISAAYCDVIIQRWIARTGLAVLREDGSPWPGPVREVAHNASS